MKPADVNKMSDEQVNSWLKGLTAKEIRRVLPMTKVMGGKPLMTKAQWLKTASMKIKRQAIKILVTDIMAT